MNQLCLVGDHDQGQAPAPVQLADEISHQMEAARIEGRGRLVQEEDLWTPQEGPRNGDPLFFPAGDFHSVSIKKCLIQAHLVQGLNKGAL